MVTDFFDFEGHVFISPTLAWRKRSSTNRRGGGGKIFFGWEKTANGYIFKKDWELNPLPNPKNS